MASVRDAHQRLQRTSGCFRIARFHLRSYPLAFRRLVEALLGVVARAATLRVLESFEHIHNITNLPQALGDVGGHRRCSPQRLMDAHEIVVQGAHYLLRSALDNWCKWSLTPQNGRQAAFALALSSAAARRRPA